jgi:hypothetical protein
MLVVGRDKNHLVVHMDNSSVEEYIIGMHLEVGMGRSLWGLEDS